MQGAPAMELSRIATAIWSLALTHNVQLKAQHLKGTSDVQEHIESAELQIQMEPTLKNLRLYECAVGASHNRQWPICVAGTLNKCVKEVGPDEPGYPRPDRSDQLGPQLISRLASKHMLRDH
ncbi:hypothetical protein RRG08_004334 [Elysia crispata]|uniref:Uncharacterized protein n=1 Tax=Elysia crispata TaxID=231223 RepID=A0AAE1AYR6_9GAST|nr:hypothetical protein RRG08_004334 [Elysia crispata]